MERKHVSNSGSVPRNIGYRIGSYAGEKIDNFFEDSMNVVIFGLDELANKAVLLYDNRIKYIEQTVERYVNNVKGTIDSLFVPYKESDLETE